MFGGAIWRDRSEGKAVWLLISSRIGFVRFLSGELDHLPVECGFAWDAMDFPQVLLQANASPCESELLTAVWAKTSMRVSV